jgi:hypothetical protein
MLPNKGLSLRIQPRRAASPQPGHRQAWTEYQILMGRRVVARFPTLKQAQDKLASMEAGQ